MISTFTRDLLLSRNCLITISQLQDALQYIIPLFWCYISYIYMYTLYSYMFSYVFLRLNHINPITWHGYHDWLPANYWLRWNLSMISTFHHFSAESIEVRFSNQSMNLLTKKIIQTFHQSMNQEINNFLIFFYWFLEIKKYQPINKSKFEPWNHGWWNPRGLKCEASRQSVATVLASHLTMVETKGADPGHKWKSWYIYIIFWSN